MNITQIYLTPDCSKFDVKFRYQYQIQTTYIQLTVESLIKKMKLDCGKFNRVVFSEGGDESRNFNIVGNNALSLALPDSTEEFKKLSSDEDIHGYFAMKYLQGFELFDVHFSTKIFSEMSDLFANGFAESLTYEKKHTSMKYDEIRIDIFGQYSRNRFLLYAKCREKNGNTRISKIYESEPDMFIVKFDVHKIEINNKEIVITNKIQKPTKIIPIADII